MLELSPEDRSKLLRKERDLRYRKKHREEIKLTRAAYYQNNRESCIATSKRRLAIFRDENITRSKAWNARNKDLVRERGTAWFKANRLKVAINGIRSRSGLKGLQFNLDIAWAESTYTGFCSITGVAFKHGEGRPSSYSPSVDRIDPSKGYLKENCRWVLFCVNAFKGRMTDDEMFTISERIYLNRKEGQNVH